MSRRPVELPNIEDATLRECLVPLTKFVTTGSDTVRPFPREPVRLPPDRQPKLGQDVAAMRPPEPDWQPAPVAWGGALPPRPAPRGIIRSPETLAEWQSLAAQEFGVFGTVQELLAHTDTELAAAALEFPQQIDGTLARLETLEDRLVLQCRAVTTLIERLHMAAAQAAIDAGSVRPFTDRATRRSNPVR